MQTSCVSSLNEKDIVNHQIAIVRSADYIFIFKEVLGGVAVSDAVLVQTSLVSSLNEEEIVNQRIPIS